MHNNLSFPMNHIKVKVVYSFKNLWCGFPVFSLKGTAFFHLTMQGI